MLKTPILCRPEKAYAAVYPILEIMSLKYWVGATTEFLLIVLNICQEHCSYQFLQAYLKARTS